MLQVIGIKMWFKGVEKSKRTKLAPVSALERTDAAIKHTNDSAQEASDRAQLRSSPRATIERTPDRPVLSAFP